MVLDQMLPLKRQRSSLDYTIPGSSSSSAAAHHRHTADSTDSNSGEEPLQPKRRVSGHINTVQVDRAQGGTTIIINNSGGSGVNSSPTPSPTLSPAPTQLEQPQNNTIENILASEVPSDVAASPNQPPRQPKLALSCNID